MTADRRPVLRTAGPADAPGLARLRYEFRAAIAPPEEPGSAFIARCTEWMASRLAGGGAWVAWLAEGDAGLSGMAWLQVIEKLPNPVAEPEWHGYVTSLYVKPEFQGAGLGSALLAAALVEGDRRLVDAVILWPTPRSRTLYQRHGFAVRDDLMERRGGILTRGPNPTP